MLLRGTSLFFAGKMADAEPALRAATHAYPIEVAPTLHLRLAQAQTALHQDANACATARRLFAVHPLLKGVDEALQSCVSPGQSVASVRAEVQAAVQKTLVSDVHPAQGAAPSLDVDDNDGKNVHLSLGDGEQVTVAVFFATWCPHCRAELPRVKSFVEKLPVAWRNRVRVLGIRTAVERENEPYAAFINAFNLNFPVYTDSTMSLAFVKFAKYAGISAGLPTLAVLDPQGGLRYILPPGDNRDTAQELTWVVDAELQRQVTRQTN